MKITAGLGHVEDYPSFVKAGADEVFCGYVPDSWILRFGQAPVNRREVRYAHVQIGERNELMILRSQMALYHAPVCLTFNALSYTPEQYPAVLDIMESCVDMGFSSFIVADPALVWYLQDHHFQGKVHLSGDFGEMNPRALKLFQTEQVSRIIFHRHLTVTEMQMCINSLPGGLEFEAFALNERCEFHGGFCASLHTDDMPPLCRMPYRLGGIHDARTVELDSPFFAPETAGGTGCGLCAVWDLKHIGVTHLKLVGRGNFRDLMLRDLALLKQARDLAEVCQEKEAYVEAVRSSLLMGQCSDNCYYR